jgi:hypothetical protein
LVQGNATFSGALTGTTASFTSSSTLLTLTSGAGTKAVFATTRNFGVNRNFQIAVDEFAESAFTITPSTTLGGAGYTTPIFTLAAAGAATFSSSVTAGGIITSRTANYPQIIFEETTFSTNSLIFYDNQAATKQMGFRVNSGSNVMTLTSSNVLIGTTSDAGFKLDVNGTARISGSATFGSSISTDGNINASYADIKLFTYQNVSGQYKFIGTEYAPGNGNNRAEIRFGIDGSDTRTKISFHVANGGGTINEALSIGYTGAATFSNLAGTGTRMVVADANGLLSTQAIGSGAITGSGTSGQVAFFNGTSSITGESNLFWDSTNDRLGIGRNNPGHKLDVYGSGPVYTMIESSQQSLAALLVRNTVKTYGVGLLGLNDDFNATDWGVADLTGGIAARLIITSGGNVIIGINTDSGDKLRVTGGNGTTFTDSIVTLRPSSTTTKSDVWKLGRAALATSAEPEDIWVRVQIGTKNYDLLAIDRGTA